MFDASTILLQKGIQDDVTIHWCLTPARLSATPHCMSDLQQAQSLLWTASVFSSYDTPLQLILFSNLARLVLLSILCWISNSSHQTRNPSCLLSPGGAMC